MITTFVVRAYSTLTFFDHSSLRLYSAEYAGDIGAKFEQRADFAVLLNLMLSSLDEDASRICKNAGVFARLRSFACTILRANGVDNVKDARFRNACGGIKHLSKSRFS